MKLKKSHFSLENQAYIDFMAEKLAASNTAKKPPTTDQAPSTQAILNRPQSEDLIWQTRPTPKDWKAVPNAKSQDEAVGMRAITVDQVIVHEQHRQAPKNELGGPLAGTTEETKTKAVSAYLFTPGLSYEDLPAEDKQKADFINKCHEESLKTKTIEAPKPKKKFISRVWKVPPFDVAVVIFLSCLIAAGACTVLALWGY